MGELGLLGMVVPEDFGGSYTDYVAYAPGGRGNFRRLWRHRGDDEHSQLRGLRPAAGIWHGRPTAAMAAAPATGEVIGCFCLTEPQAGSEAHNLRTRAELVDGQWVINGAKQFVSNARRAGLAIVFAVTDPDLGKKGLSAFLVPTDNPGFKVDRSEHKMGIRALIPARSRSTTAGYRPPTCWASAAGPGHRLVQP